MAREPEARYLVIKNKLDLNGLVSKHIAQSYLSLDPERVVRIRLTNGEKPELTVKGKPVVDGDFRDCPEFEVDLPLDKAKGMMELSAGGVEKNRFDIPHANDLKIELDVFVGENEGLVLAEIEDPQKRPIDKTLLPEWIGDNISALDHIFSNVSLAVRPVSQWSEDEKKCLETGRV